MLSYLLKVTLCWSLFYLLYHLWLGRETFFKINRWYLLGTAILGALIPLIDFQSLIYEEPTFVHYFQPISVGVDQLEEVIVTASAAEAGIDWWNILIKIYWLGVGLAFSRFLFGLFKINKLYNEGKKSTFSDYQFILTSAFHAPFSFFKNLFWSKDFEVDEVDKQNILRHEEAHIFQWHSIDIILFEILGILFWCSPFIYFYKKAIKDTHEFLADDYVVAHASRKKYGRLLLRQSQSLQQGLPIAISNSFFSSQLKNRIVMMTKNRSNKKASLKYLAGLPLLALLFLAFSFQQKTPSNSTLSNPSGITTDTMPGGDVFKVVEEMPLFAGSWEEVADKLERKKLSDKKMLEFIYTNIKYPAEAREKNIQGMVVTSFIVEKDGSISDAKIVRSIGSGCDEEVLRVVSAMPNWLPGKQNGKEVRVQYNLPVKFKLEGDAENNKNEIPCDKTSELDTDVFKVVEDMPRFPGCEEMTDKEERKTCAQTKMLEFIYTNIKYPASARDNGIEGITVVKFIVEKDGSINDAEIVRSIGGECDEEVLKLVYMMPNWIPGKQSGKDVRVQYILPVKFKLEGGSEKPIKIDEADELPYMASCKDVEKSERKNCSDQAMLHTIYGNIKYPKEAFTNKVEGMVVAKFIIEKDGAVTKPSIFKSLGSGCDEEVLKVISQMPNWVPGYKNGKAVAVEFTLPVKFKLQDDNKVINVEGKNLNESPIILKAFPNPASDKLSIEFKASPGQYKMVLTDVNGVKYFIKNLNDYDGEALNIADFSLKDKARGTAYLTIVNEKGETIKSTTVILQ